ncbi:MAG: hypothetical protein KUG77_16995 [Nannocystaceae bacterium]|nr:hypothetical protein [Nannocystaceae bacterium]
MSRVRRRVWILGLLANAACSRPGSSQAPVSDPNATLVVALQHAEEAPTAIRMEVSNPNATAVSFCRVHTAFEGLSSDIFEVRAPDESEVPYRGPMLKRAPPEPEDWFLVQPGRFHTAQVDLLNGYALRGGTTYAVRYRSSSVSTLPTSAWFDFAVE